MTDSARLEAIEIKLAHLEQAMQQLSDAVIHQRRDIQSLQARVLQLGQQWALAQAAAAAGEGDADGYEKPPHY